MATKKCEKCGKVMDEGQFYTYKDGRKTELCKKCLTMHIDAFDPSTFMWLLEKMNVPYIPAEWDVLKNKAYEKDPLKFSSMAVFGKYLSKMKLKQFKNYGWEDGPRLIAEAEGRAAERNEEMDQFYKDKFLNGEISEAEYKTLTSTVSQRETRQEMTSDINNPYLGPNNPYNENNFMKEEEMPNIAADLTQEDKLYLASKWGRMYQPEEWVLLETSYDQMMKSFDVQDADTINTLILICKTNLKMNQSLDNGDIEGYQKLSKVSEGLRKTAKFTAAQNKENKGDFVDSIGELILMCERDGFIPRYATDIPQDKVDQTLKDQKDYIYKLVTQDLGFGQQIEDALRKIEIQRQMEEDEKRRVEEQGDDYDPYDVEELTDEQIVEYNEEIKNQKEEDAQFIEDWKEEEENGIN